MNNWLGKKLTIWDITDDAPMLAKLIMAYVVLLDLEANTELPESLHAALEEKGINIHEIFPSEKVCSTNGMSASDMRNAIYKYQTGFDLLEEDYQ